MVAIVGGGVLVCFDFFASALARMSIIFSSVARSGHIWCAEIGFVFGFRVMSRGVSLGMTGVSFGLLFSTVVFGVGSLSSGCPSAFSFFVLMFIGRFSAIGFGFGGVNVDARACCLGLGFRILYRPSGIAQVIRNKCGSLLKSSGSTKQSVCLINVKD